MMLKYSFASHYSNCTKERIIEFMKETDKPFKYTYGFKYRGPSTYLVPITREQALKYLQKGSFVEVTECEDYIDVNEYSDNDMW